MTAVGELVPSKIRAPLEDVVIPMVTNPPKVCAECGSLIVVAPDRMALPNVVYECPVSAARSECHSPYRWLHDQLARNEQAVSGEAARAGVRLAETQIHWIAAATRLATDEDVRKALECLDLLRPPFGLNAAQVGALRGQGRGDEGCVVS